MRPARLSKAAGVAAAAAIAVAVALPQAGAHPDRSPRKATGPPNVVVIMTDDQTVESLRVMQNVRNLLAARGTTFVNSFVTFSLCCPSRATFLTGQYAHNHHVVGNVPRNGLDRFDQSNTLPVWLRRRGYATIQIGKYLNGYRLRAPKAPPGWTEWHAAVKLAYFGWSMVRAGKKVSYGYKPQDYQTDVFTRTAVAAIRRHAAGPRPFFLWLAYYAPHEGNPIEIDDPGILLTPVPAPRHKGRFASEPLPRPASFNEGDVSDKPWFVRRRAPFNPEVVAAITVNYRQRLETLLAVDEGVAKIVATLRDAGVLDRTLIVFTSDNGFFQGEHRLSSGKEQVYEPSIRVPLIVRGPGVPEGLRLDQPVANIDLAPTIVDAANARSDLAMDGRSLLPLLRDPTLEWGRDVLIERGPGGSGTIGRLFTAIRTPRFLYASYKDGERELYDLETDPDELESRQRDPLYAGMEGELARRLATLRDCAGERCRRGPALRLDPVDEYKAGCARAVRIDGADVQEVRYVEFLRGAQLLSVADRPPFEHFFPRREPETAVRIRALSVLDDGRRFTTDREVVRCGVR